MGLYHYTGHGQVSWKWCIAHVRYIDLYVEGVVNRDNIGLLYHIAAKIKSVKGLLPNGEPEEDNTVSKEFQDESWLTIEPVQASRSHSDYHP